MDKINLIIADDHKVVRQSLVTALAKYKEINVLAEASDGNEVVEKYEKYDADLILMDLNMPNINGIEATKILKAKFDDVKILMLSMYDNNNFIMDALTAGIDGYILKMSDLPDLITAIKTVARGDEYFDLNITGKMSDIFASENDEEIETAVISAFGITSREIEIIRMITDCYSVEQISDRLQLSLHTVKNHKRNILKKLKLKNTAELMKFAIRHKICRV